jgi:octanoyl-[GcvH]:protein N-octanoyltransferase
VEIATIIGLDPPEDGFGLQQAVLEEVAAGSRGPTALLWTTGSRYVGATRPETRLPGFGEAVGIARAAGFPVLIRNSGGGAVAANAGSISFSLTFPVGDMRRDLYERYDEGAALVVDAMERVGISAEPGEVAGEFCPGAYSVRTGGPEGTKIAGLAQRVTRRAARLEALVVVSQAAELRSVLRGFYGALGLPFRPESVGDLPGTDVAAVIRGLSEAVRKRYPRSAEARIREETMRRARELRETWRPGPVSSNV